MRSVCIIVALLLAPRPTAGAELEIETRIPEQHDWRDFGWVLSTGEEGEWDRHLGGMLTASTAKRNGIYFLYYGGACCYDDPLDSVTFRAIGVATSTDGIRFSKHPENPIISWLPNNGREEGATSSAVATDATERTILYFGANTQETRTTVNADARIGLSRDGLAFADQGIALHHRDRMVWGSGDEIFPIIALRHEDLWALYYLTNGVPQQRHLGVAWGRRFDQLTESRAAKASGRLVPVWGVGGGAVRLGAETYALFLNDLRIPRTEVRTVQVDSPHLLSEPAQTYRWPEVKQVTVLLDSEVATWFMYYRDAEQQHYGVKLAPAGEPDATPPSSPGSLAAEMIDATGIRLTWSHSTDSETGVAQYIIYRDSERVDATARESVHDFRLRPETTYAYQVSAVNFHGLESPLSSPLTVRTLRP